MHHFAKLALKAAACCVLAQATHASVVITYNVQTLKNELGVLTPAGTLLQLIDLGPNGVFDSVDISDGTTTNLTQFVSGDDKVINISFLKQGSAAGDFTSTAAFDLSANAVEPVTGNSSRTFEIELGAGANQLPGGTKIGLRWFPTLQANSYYSGQGITLTAGTHYGQFTRQSGAFSADLWISPGADGGRADFDPLTVTNDGPTASYASFSVVPEPAAIGLSLIGAAGMALLRRRRS
jgi:hypothetical protein